MKPIQVSFPCGSITLEGLFYSPPEREAVPAVTVCHPHPLYGGSMHNNVTYAIAAALVEAGMAALLFNFRGVGRSGGRHGGGVAEQEDIRSALDWLQGQPGVDTGRLGLAGYSFGGGVALPVACSDERVKAVALVSPYFEGPPDALLRDSRKPKLILGGGHDDMVQASDIERYGRDAAGPKTCLVVQGADHFWGGYEGMMAEKVSGFFKNYL